jgi:serine/threonine protein kinase
MIGQTLGPYKILEQIGSGGMATVYKAYHAAMERNVAIKVLPANMAQDPNFTARFAQEARTIARLEHPFILPVYDSGNDKGVHYIVMRYMEAGTLGDLLNKRQPDLRYSVRLIQRVAEALDYAHSQGIVHRDIKPNNILIDKNGQPYLTDFGIAKIVEGSLNLTGSAIIGTPAYMSPEQGQGIPVDNRSDIYSLGVMLYEMVTGRRPFDADTPMAVLIKHIQDPLPPPSSIVKDIPPRLEQAILKSLAKDRKDRYATAGEFARALEESLIGTMAPAVLPAREPSATVAVPARTGLVSPSPTGRPPTGTAAAKQRVTARQAPIPASAAMAEERDQDDQEEKKSGFNWIVMLGCAGLGLLLVTALAIGAVFLVPGLIPADTFGSDSSAQTATFQAAYNSAVSTAQALSTANAVNITQSSVTLQPGISPTVEIVTQPADATITPPPPTTPAPTETPGNTGCNDNAKFITDVTIPDNTPLDANTPFTKTWRVENTGTCEWQPEYTLRFVGGVQMSAPGSVSVQSFVSPGGQVDISVNMVAPAAPGTYTGEWRLANKDGALFGTNNHNLTVVIVVPATATPTPTATLTPTPGLIIVLPPLILVSPASFSPSSVGSAYSNNTTSTSLTVGDTSGDLAVQGFATFDLSLIPNNATITAVKLDLSSFSTSPGPTSNPFSLGCLRVYEQNYGSLDGSDYFAGGASGALWRFCDAGQLSDPAQQAADAGGIGVIQNGVGIDKVQLRFQFNQTATNNNHVPDLLQVAPKLIISFTTP